eukprot:NODE_2876_length_851_cov_28.583541_g2378_i0.p2 GENE.NODE_2876_length_851_cov_28.583541_g2378_i0~~NODE_2876_length_851_cov_28.583541_g2378_i0.p2  ORF type:complete len:133 (+),score=39.02 NODE_2876_length_851_cov_28.583541_g2378_i0:103-501(+)
MLGGPQATPRPSLLPKPKETTLGLPSRALRRPRATHGKPLPQHMFKSTADSGAATAMAAINASTSANLMPENTSFVVAHVTEMEQQQQQEILNSFRSDSNMSAISLTEILTPHTARSELDHELEATMISICH